MRLLISMIRAAHHRSHGRMHKAHLCGFFLEHFERVRVHITAYRQMVADDPDGAAKAYGRVFGTEPRPITGVFAVPAGQAEIRVLSALQAAQARAA